MHSQATFPASFRRLAVLVIAALVLPLMLPPRSVDAAPTAVGSLPNRTTAPGAAGQSVIPTTHTFTL